MPPQPRRNIDWKHESQHARDVYKKWGQLIVQSWLDPEFEAKFKADPAKVMRDNGIDLPSGVAIDPQNFQLPRKPADMDATSFGVGSGEALKVSCMGSASSLTCPGCTAACAGSGDC